MAYAMTTEGRAEGLGQVAGRINQWLSAVVTALLCVAIVLIAWSLAGCGDASAAGSAGRPAFVAQAWCKGTSMLPAFKDGEMVGVELCRFSDLHTGDTVIYWHNETKQYIHHRIFQWSDTRGRWVTKGDNNPNYDRGFMSSDEFVGRTHKL